MFPILKERAKNRGTELSGGEQQMLAIGRALMTNADLLLLDEPSEGLAPLIVRGIGDLILTLKQEGLSILLVEQNVTMATRVADYVYVISNGQHRLRRRCPGLQVRRDRPRAVHRSAGGRKQLSRGVSRLDGTEW